MKVLAAKKEKSPEEKAQRKKELQQIRKDVFEGRRARTPGGLCSDDLVLNNKGLYVAVSRPRFRFSNVTGYLGCLLPRVPVT